MGGGGGKGWFGGTAGSKKAQVQQGLQDKHVKGTNNHKREIAKGNHPSILEADPQKLLDSFAGKGVRLEKNPSRERVNFGRIIGKYYDAKSERGIPHRDAS